MQEKKKFILVVVVSLIFLSIQGGIIYLVDPYLRYRKPIYNKIVGSTGSPALYPGILRNYEYNSVVLGTSMAQNFKVKDLNKDIGGNFINIAQSGAHISETLDLFEVAKEKKIDNVVMSLDIFSFQNLERASNTQKYLYLFQKPYSLREYKYLFNIDSWMQIVRIILKDNKNPYELGYWANDGYIFSKEEVLKYYKKINNVKIKEFNIEEMKKNYREYLEKIIKENPEIQFYFFYPPYSVLTYKNQELDIDGFLKFKLFLSNELLKYDNVILSDYQSEEKIIYNLDLYKDLTHYSPEINKYILENLKNEKYRLNNTNYKEKILLLKEKIELHSLTF